MSSFEIKFVVLPCGCVDYYDRHLRLGRDQKIINSFFLSEPEASGERRFFLERIFNGHALVTALSSYRPRGYEAALPVNSDRNLIL